MYKAQWIQPPKWLPKVESNLIPVYDEAEAVPAPVLAAVVEPSGIPSILSFIADTKSFRASSSSFESPLTYTLLLSLRTTPII